MIVPTVILGPRRAATLNAAATLAPEEVPAKIASSLARRLAVCLASDVET
jgi:hypothetical protein